MIETILASMLFGFALGACTVRIVDSFREKRGKSLSNKVYPTKPWPPPPPAANR